MRRVAVAVSLLLPFSGALAQGRADDRWLAVEIGQQVGRQLNDAMTAAVAMREASGRATAEVAQARRRYWQMVASGADATAAREEFAFRLRGKDLYYLLFAVPEGPTAATPVVMNAISGGIDGGIRPSARAAFYAWVGHVRIYLGASGRGMVLPNEAQLRRAMELARSAEALYVRERDWAEAEASGVAFPWQSNARDHALMLLNRYGRMRTLAQAREQYAALVEFFGEKRVLDAAERVRLARRADAGTLVDPATLGVRAATPSGAFGELLGAGDGEWFVRFAAWYGREDAVWARRRVERLTWAYGVPAVRAAGEKVRPALRSDDWGLEARARLTDQKWHVGLNPLLAVEGLLAVADAPGWTRWLAASRDSAASTPAQMEAAYRALAGRLGERALTAVADTLREFWYGETWRLSPRTQQNHQQLVGFYAGAGKTTPPALLDDLLAKGSVATLGDPGARTEEERMQLAGANLTGFERRWAVYSARANRERDRDTLTYSESGSWYDGRILKLQRVNERFRSGQTTANPRLDHLVGTDLHDAVRTFQAHCAAWGDPAGPPCRLLELTKAEFADVWPMLLPEYRTPPTDDLATAGGLKALMGAWRGSFTNRLNARDRGPLAITLAMPTRAGEAYGTLVYAQCTATYRFTDLQGGVYYFDEVMSTPNCRDAHVGLVPQPNGKLAWYRYKNRFDRPLFYSGGLISTANYEYYGELERPVELSGRGEPVPRPEPPRSVESARRDATSGVQNTPPVADAPGIAGNWSGQAVQGGSRYEVQLAFEDLRRPGERAGRSSYPQLRCVGELVFVSEQNGEYTFRERITPARPSCIDGMIKVRRTNDAKLEWRWYDAGGRQQVSATLSRK
jgi:hypothetical protein